MTPEERKLLSGLFDRIRTASNQTRDREAESFIGDAVRQQPYAPYLLAQTVIVQDQALQAANTKLQDLEEKVRRFEAGSHGQGDTSFLGGLGRSIFGGGSEPPPRSPVPSAGGYAQGGPGPNQGGYQQGPWGQGGAPAQEGGGFLKGALGAAAGVAGGVLLANSISGLFRGNSLGIGAGMPGLGGGFGGGGETIVNNYYENDGDRGGGDYGSDNDQGGGFDSAADFGSDNGGFGSDDGGFGSDDGYNV